MFYIVHVVIYRDRDTISYWTSNVTLTITVNPILYKSRLFKQDIHVENWNWFAQSWIRQLSNFLTYVCNSLYKIQLAQLKFALRPEGEKGENKTGAKFSLYTVF